ncbi:MAG: hypothetical protein VB064_10370 [Oscillospiraceae bacterium]|nr:hypothetical protein [Oscillospiraceae bacterium]
MEKFKVERRCGTCEFNYHGICAGGDDTHKNGEQITNLFSTCKGWGISYGYFREVEKHKPWYIKGTYSHGNAYMKSDLVLLEMDYNDEPIEVNIFDLIERVYSLQPNELAEVLGVTPSVIYRAKARGTPKMRKAAFSQVLKIPEFYFDRVTTCDFPIIEKCKDEFMQEWENVLPKIKVLAERKYQEKTRKELEDERPARTEENARLIEKYRSTKSYVHDLTDDYKMRWYTIAIRLQEERYKGTIYYRICCGDYGLTVSLMEDILDFIASLDCDEIDAQNYEGLLLNDISLFADPNNNDIHFVLRDDFNHELKKYIPASQIQKFIVGFEIINSDGSGKMKERRNCLSCSHFSLIDGTAKGYCEIRHENVQRSRIICAFNYEERKPADAFRD